MNKKIKIKISVDDSNYVERLHFEYRAALNIIAFLMSKEDVREEHLQRYLDVTELKYAELEMAKEAVTSKYRPANMPERCSYSFEFNTEEIVFWVE